MSDNALSIITPSQPQSHTCKDAIPTPESAAGNVLEDSLCYLMEKVKELGVEHCKGYCANCRSDEPGYNAPSNEMKYQHLKRTVHQAFRYLPIPVYKNIAAPANGKCPACLIFEALEKLFLIARYSSARPMGYETFPCYWEPCTDGEAIIGTAALAGFRVNANEIHGMPPDVKREVRENLLPAQEILKRINDLGNGKKERLSDDDLWVLLGRENAIKALERPPSFEWKEWAKSGIFSERCSMHGERVSLALFIVFSCDRAISSQKGCSSSDDISYESIRQLYTTMSYILFDYAMSEDEFRDIFRDNVAGRFIAISDYNYNEPLYELTTLGKTAARKYLGDPPPFFCDELQISEENAPPENPIQDAQTVAIQSETTNDLDFMADLTQNTQASSKAKAAIENNMMKLEANPTLAPVFNLPDPAESIAATDKVSERWFDKGREVGWIEALAKLSPTPNLDKRKDGADKLADLPPDTDDTDNRTMLTSEQIAKIAGEKAGLKQNPTPETMRTLMARKGVPAEKVRIRGRDNNTYDEKLAMPHIEQWATENKAIPF